MKDFAVRIWDSKNKEMVIITDLTIHNFYKLHSGENTEDPMLASPYYDQFGVRLFENDIVDRLPGDQDDEAKEYGYRYGIVRLNAKSGWVLYNPIKEYNYYMKDELISELRWSSRVGPHPMSLTCERIGDIYSTPDIIPRVIEECKLMEEAKKREKELQCLIKLKEKYECEA
jgi:hypothetical protein